MTLSRLEAAPTGAPKARFPVVGAASSREKTSNGCLCLCVKLKISLQEGNIRLLAYSWEYRVAFDNSKPWIGIGRSRLLASGAPSLFRMHSMPEILPHSPRIRTGLAKKVILTPSCKAASVSRGFAGIWCSLYFLWITL